MLPTQRGQILQQRVVQRLAVGTQSTGGTLQIDRVSQHDGRRHQIEAAGPVALLLKTAVADFTQSVEEDRLASALRASPIFSPALGTRRRSSTLCSQSRMNSVRSMRPSSRDGQTVLARIAAELAQHQRGRHRALLDRSGQP